MASFTIAYNNTKANEGGYANVEGDNGGETYAGVTRKNYPSWRGWAIIDKNKPLSHGQIIVDSTLSAFIAKFYLDNYWHRIGGDNIEDQDLANQVFDFAVTAGVTAAINLLKQS